MRKEMEIVEYGIKESGFSGRLSPFGFSLDEICEIIAQEQEEDRYIEELEKDWRDSLASQKEREMAFDFPQEERNEMRRRFLEQRYEDVTKEFFEAKKRGEDIANLARERFHRKIEYEIFTYRPKDDKTIPAHQILKARQYPLEKLVESKRFMALCPFHNEKSPSMYIKNNFYFCFGCGEKGNAIDFVMKTKGFNFQEAVKYLS